MAKTVTVSQLQPLAGYVLVEPVQAPKQTASGIYLPDSHEEKIKKAKVVAVGLPTYKGDQKVEAPVKAGDVVLYKKEWDKTELKMDGVEYELLKFDDLIALVK